MVKCGNAMGPVTNVFVIAALHARRLPGSWRRWTGRRCTARSPAAGLGSWAHCMHHSGAVVFLPRQPQHASRSSAESWEEEEEGSSGGSSRTRLASGLAPFPLLPNLFNSSLYCTDARDAPPNPGCCHAACGVQHCSTISDNL